MMATQLPKISVVTPSYNQGRFIEDAILSVLHQEYDNVEHIIIDGGSTDSTLEVLQKYPHLKWISEPDEGQSDALNKGFKQATGELVGWLNADDYFTPAAFDAVVRHSVKKTDVDVFVGSYYFVNENGCYLKEMRSLPYMKAIALYGFCYPSSGAFFRRRIFESDYYLSKDYEYIMDMEYYLRLSQAGFKLFSIPEFVNCFRWHDDNKSLEPMDATDDSHQDSINQHVKEKSAVYNAYGITVSSDKTNNYAVNDWIRRRFVILRALMRFCRGDYFWRLYRTYISKPSLEISK